MVSDIAYIMTVAEVKYSCTAFFRTPSTEVHETFVSERFDTFRDVHLDNLTTFTETFASYLFQVLSEMYFFQWHSIEGSVSDFFNRIRYVDFRNFGTLEHIVSNNFHTFFYFEIRNVFTRTENVNHIGTVR